MLNGNAIDSDTVVLIVENDPADKQMLKTICQDVGFAPDKTVTVSELEEAIGLVNRGDIDIVLLDLELDDAPNPSRTVALIARWKNETRNKKIPVIVVSRFTEVVTVAARLQCSAVLKKPGLGEGERYFFSEHLKSEIGMAIAQKSDRTTFLDRIRQLFNQPWHLHIFPGGSVTVKDPLALALLWCISIACYVVFLTALGKSRGWPTSVVASLCSALILSAVVLWVVTRRKRSKK
jgi:CheY-like chemotaxis protein